MKAVIVLAMHGAPPLDFPRPEMAEFLQLHARIGHDARSAEDKLRDRYAELEKKIRTWPRSAQNDPFFAGSEELAAKLRQESGLEVVVGFNEFCAPSFTDALDEAARKEAETVIVVTPMMTRGGEHSAVDIPAAIRRAESRHPRKKFIYAWPFDPSDIARFLASQVKKFL